jgi:mannose-6-phosphate isomerase-like protein (cupin superfamily)
VTDGYTHKRLDEVEDSAPKFGSDEFQEARFASSDLEAEQTGISHFRIHPGKRQPFAHHHDRIEEIYVVLAGSGRVKLGDEIVELSALDAIRVSPTVIRSFEAGPEGLEFIAVGACDADDRGEILPGWWQD